MPPYEPKADTFHGVRDQNIPKKLTSTFDKTVGEWALNERVHAA